MDTDAVRTGEVIRWRRRHLVVNRAPEIIVTHRSESCGLRVLPKLHYPHAPSLIEVKEDRLSDLRFGENGFEFQIWCDLESAKCLSRTERCTLRYKRLGSSNRGGK